ncbi:hypothetical protein E2I00_014330 [Balaenoptera physalus]|uniref:C2 domain-containing protein n=1 Tax=Balaenoptera physalus TaxID=9770 RepID=A0A643BVV3_BALPH|nr:hypothetical protein E2I00_014330 [Balaenoptera physalus]
MADYPVTAKGSADVKRIIAIISTRTRQEILSWTNQSDLCVQFNVKKSTEPVQPRALLKFPDIYGPRPAVTAPEVINYADYTLRTTEEPAAPASPQAPNDSRLKRQVTEELLVLPQNGVVQDVCVMETWNPEKAARWNQAPKLHYRLDYDRQKAELFVTCLEAVTSDHDGGCDCYIQGSVANRMGSVEAQTALKKRQLHTTWEEGLALPLAEGELPTATLTLTLRTCDRFSRHSVAGELCLGLDGVSVPLGAAQWGELKTSVKEASAGTGEVLLSISYLPAANRLLVVLIKAKNLHANQSKELLGKVDAPCTGQKASGWWAALAGHAALADSDGVGRLYPVQKRKRSPA